MDSLLQRELNGLREERIVRYSKRFYLLRVGALFISVLVPTAALAWGVASGHMRQSILTMLCLVPLGFALFALSTRAPVYCRRCSRALAQHWSEEKRSDGRYSGPVFVCGSCRVYEARISYDFEG